MKSRNALLFCFFCFGIWSIDAQEKNQELLAKLNATQVTLDFSETPLSQVLEFLATVSGISIQLDSDTLTQQDADSISITMTLSDTSLWNVLKLIVALQDLSLEVKEGIVLIGRKKLTEEKFFKTDFIDVTELLKKAKITPRVLIYLIQEKTGFEHWRELKTYLKPVQFLVEVTENGTVSSHIREKLFISQTPELIDQTHLSMDRFEMILERRGQLIIPESIHALDAKMSQVTLTLEFSETPVEQILDFLQDITEISILVAPEAQKEIQDQTVSFAAESIATGKALSQILERISESLYYSYQEGGVLIEKKNFEVLQTKGKEE